MAIFSRVPGLKRDHEEQIKTMQPLAENKRMWYSSLNQQKGGKKMVVRTVVLLLLPFSPVVSIDGISEGPFSPKERGSFFVEGS